MNRFTKLALTLGMACSIAACTRIETGTVGVRQDFNRQIENTERLPGSWNQTLVGDILTFPIKSVQVDVTNLTPLASDNSTIADFDVAIVYSINPGSVAEIYATKNRGFHATDDETGDIYLMYNRVAAIARNSAYKAARGYEALRMNDNRAQMENTIRADMIATLEEENLDGAVNIEQVLIRQITPAEAIIASSNALVQAQNELRRKEVEVRTASLEAQRIRTLSENAGATEYMQAQAQLMIAQGVRDGNVNTIVVPSDFRGMVNVSAR